MTTALKANELLYLSMLCGADEVFGLPDVFHGKTDDEIKAYVDDTAIACADKKLCAADFEGRHNLNECVAATIRVIASADTITEIIIRNTRARQQRYLLYYKGKDKAILFESGGDYFIADETELEKAHIALRILFAKGCLLKLDVSSFAIAQEEIAEVCPSKKSRVSGMRALMRDKGVDDIAALLIAEGIAGRAGYFSAATIDRSDNSVVTAYFLADSGIVLQVATNVRGNMEFSSTDNEAALQTAQSFLGGDFYV